MVPNSVTNLHQWGKEQTSSPRRVFTVRYKNNLICIMEKKIVLRNRRGDQLRYLFATSSLTKNKVGGIFQVSPKGKNLGKKL